MHNFLKNIVLIIIIIIINAIRLQIEHFHINLFCQKIINNIYARNNMMAH